MIKNFGSLIGNRVTLALLQRSIDSGTIPHLSIFSGIHGTGKSTSAQIAALALTCQNPQKGNPCLQCEHCKANLATLNSTGQTPYIKKINVGKLDTKTDVLKLIKDMFVLTAMSTTVYIFEEAHKLSSDAQECLKEELDRVPDNLYVMMTTTKLRDIQIDLQSRAINFPYNRISAKDARLLLLKTCDTKGYSKITTSAVNTVLAYAKGIPRDIINLVDFLCTNARSDEEICEFLNIVGKNTFVLWFTYLKATQILEAYNLFQDIMSKISIDNFVQQLKEFILDAIFAQTGCNPEGLSQQDLSEIVQLFNGVDLNQIASIVERLSASSTQVDVELAMLKIKQIMHKKSLKEVITENNSVAMEQSKEAGALHSSQEALMHTPTDKSNRMAPLTMQAFNRYGGNNASRDS